MQTSMSSVPSLYLHGTDFHPWPVLVVAGTHLLDGAHHTCVVEGRPVPGAHEARAGCCEAPAGGRWTRPCTWLLLPVADIWRTACESPQGLGDGCDILASDTDGSPAGQARDPGHMGAVSGRRHGYDVWAPGAEGMVSSVVSPEYPGWHGGMGDLARVKPRQNRLCWLTPRGPLAHHVF